MLQYFHSGRHQKIIKSKRDRSYRHDEIGINRQEEQFGRQGKKGPEADYREKDSFFVIMGKEVGLINMLRLSMRCDLGFVLTDSRFWNLRENFI